MTGDAADLPPPALAEMLTAFGQLLHAAGVPVTPTSTGRFATAIVAAAPATGFAPPRAEASFFGFLSGRGLY